MTGSHFEISFVGVSVPNTPAKGRFSGTSKTRNPLHRETPQFIKLNVGEKEKKAFCAPNIPQKTSMQN